MRVANLPEEGLAIADLDGDGQNEIVAGTHWYVYDRASRVWRRHRFVDEALAYVTTVVAVADVDGDGEVEIVLSEGDACIYGRADEGGRVAWFKRGPDPTLPWTEHVVATGLLDPHSLQAVDVGRGVVDLVVGEIGLKRQYVERPPRLMLFRNDGRGRFEPTVIDAGTGTHHARLADFFARGRPDLASRPLHGTERWNIHLYLNETASL